MKRTFILLFTAFTGFLYGQVDSITPQLPGMVIRSFTVNEGQSLAGIKGASGDGLVYRSAAGEWNWQATNGGLALDTNVEDVQAVAIINESIFLAGTWKSGLFRTENAGDDWQKLENFPAKDIRSIKVGQSEPKIVFAATTTHGILRSTDLGVTWKQCAPDSMTKTLASWSIELDQTNPSVIYAMTFGNGIQRSANQGRNWKKVLEHKGVLFFDLAISHVYGTTLVAAGSSDTLGVIYTSGNEGLTWTMHRETPKALFNNVAFAGTNDEVILVGSWDKGAFICDKAGWAPLKSVSFDNISGIYTDSVETIFATWGNGIYRFDNEPSHPEILDELSIETIDLSFSDSPYYGGPIGTIEERIISERINRKGTRKTIMGYTMEIIGYDTLTQLPQPIFGPRKKFRRVEAIPPEI
jgi:photosystem II stability/assembly factor-like uncharacterized protein